MGRCALTYADQAEADHAALKAAVRAGEVQALRQAYSQADQVVRSNLVSRSAATLLHESNARILRRARPGIGGMSAASMRRWGGHLLHEFGNAG